MRDARPPARDSFSHPSSLIPHPSNRAELFAFAPATQKFLTLPNSRATRNSLQINQLPLSPQWMPVCELVLRKEVVR